MPGQWVARLDQAVSQAPGSVVIVAHSLGCIATVLWNRQCHPDRKRRIRGALLVAPCDPEIDAAAPPLQRFAPVPSVPIGFRSILIASANDPYASIGKAKAYADAWGCEFVNIGDAGHINSRSNLGCWQYGQELLDALLTDC
jgi:predicted alpha/beta hydrolase family esterase